MFFIDICNEVIGARFKPGQLPSVKRWVNLREAQLWTAADWPWKLAGPQTLAISHDQASPPVASDLQIPIALYDENGAQLEYLPQPDFDSLYAPVAANQGKGKPEHWKWVNEVLTLGPTPEAAAVYKISYYRDLSHWQTNFHEPGARGDHRGGSNLQIVVGPMVRDDDFPLFDIEWHEILTIGAIATGLKIENDPTWESLEQEFAFMLDTMRDHYLPTLSVAGNLQYGRDNF